jgi:hypothetical protein
VGALVNCVTRLARDALERRQGEGDRKVKVGKPSKTSTEGSSGAGE